MENKTFFQAMAELLKQLEQRKITMKFYQNMECKIIAELPNDESVIELVTGMYYENNHDDYQ